MCSQGVPPTDVYYLDKSSVVKPVCLAGAGLPYVDAAVADNRSAADRQGSSKDCCGERGKAPCGSNALLYLPRSKGAEAYVRLTKVKGAVRLYCNEDPAMKMVREFEERAEEMGRRSMVKEAFRFAEELGLELDLKLPSFGQEGSAEVSRREDRGRSEEPGYGMRS